MAESTIPVDLFNPGQVFACIGLVEAAETLLGGAEGAFDWSRSATTRFSVRADGMEKPVERVLRFLAAATVAAEVPHGSPNRGAWLKGWGPCLDLGVGDPYPFGDPDSPATLRAVLASDGKRLIIDHWGDTVRNSVKFWAGAGGYPGAALARDALDLVRTRCAGVPEDPFALSAPQTSSFRLDWRRDYIPVDAGFSLNAHDKMCPVGFPLVELLAAHGLTHARPRARSKLEYCYDVAGRDATSGDELWLRPSILRAILGGGALPFPTRRFRMALGWPGKEGQARAITTVTEEIIA